MPSYIGSLDGVIRDVNRINQATVRSYVKFPCSLILRLRAFALGQPDGSPFPGPKRAKETPYRRSGMDPQTSATIWDLSWNDLGPPVPSA